MSSIPFHVEHLAVMDVRRQEAETVLTLAPAREALSNIPGNHIADAITLMYDGRIIACMGYILILPGVVEVWLIPSVYVPKYPKFFIREVKNYLKTTAEVFNWHRAQTDTLDTPEARRWMEAIGFVEEGRKKNYYLGQDYIMSARYFNRSEV